MIFRIDQDFIEDFGDSPDDPQEFVRRTPTIRHYFLDDVEVSEEEYTRAQDAAIETATPPG